MVESDIVLEHVVSKRGIEVDRVKVEVIKTLPYPNNTRDVRSFLGHAGFYHRFIKDFSKTANLMRKLLHKDAEFIFDEECKVAFDTFKDKLITAPIIKAPNWELPLEIMTDAINYAIGAVLGQREGKSSHVI
ncbi:putative mitochondrial protein AtMg00860 [Silene latifolia]|uniref:putative mitochondrial protein AtMg00860 n=1 Tax=Silene latifolia TaxID=37657 RepID=UPI003D785A4E